MPTIDLLVIGGGIHGAAIARDAALRGLSVTLVEKDDLASGTSSRSSKLVHGGLRYLETFQFGLVREALAERAVLLHTAPWLVRPLPFLLPIYRGASRARWKIGLGLTFYDRFAGRAGGPPHRMLSAAEARALEPSLPSDGLVGAALYHDAQMDDARLVVANAVAAEAAGARVRTRTRVEGLAPAEGPSVKPVWRAHLATGEVIEARAVVNATGAWADALRARAGLMGVTEPLVRPTRGAHVVVPALTRTHALLLFAGADQRVFFVLPWGEFSLVGTTDVDEPGAPDAVRPTSADLRYLWREIAARWPQSAAARDPAGSTARAFAGLRSLVRRPHGQARPWDNAREAHIVVDRGLFTLVGGKYTTARRLAQHTVDRVAQWIERDLAPCTTAKMPLPPSSIVGAPDAASVAAAARQEFAKSVSDVVWRRSSLWLDRRAARAAAPQIGAWLAPALGWSDAERDAHVAHTLSECDAEERDIRDAAMTEAR